jgi:glyoxylase-like metal-dependent hydrolase (beta-lactamase superfamily II)
MRTKRGAHDLPPALRQHLRHLHITPSSRHGGEALTIDPVLERVDRYLQLVRELDLKLVKAVDTHLHADHVTGLGALRDRTHCIAKYVLTPAANGPREKGVACTLVEP